MIQAGKQFTLDALLRAICLLQLTTLLLNLVEPIQGTTTTTTTAWITDIPEEVALIGSDARLACNMTPAEIEDKILLVFWYRNESLKPLYTIDARNSSLSKAEHVIDETFGKRATLRVSYPMSYLRVNPVREEDDAEYRCRIDYKRSPTRNTFIRLKVIVPVSRLTISEENGKLIDAIGGPYEEGSRRKFVCTSYGGSPRPSLVWWKGFSLMNSTFTEEATGTQKSAISLLLNRGDFRTNLTCQAFTHNLTTSLRKSIQLDLNLKPTEVVLVPKNVNLTTETMAQFICSTKGSIPVAKIVWYKDNKRIKEDSGEVQQIGNNVHTFDTYNYRQYNGDFNEDQHAHHSSSDGTRSTITFLPSPEDNNKRLTCVAVNPRIDRFQINDSLVMNVTYPPLVSLVLGANALGADIMEGSNVYFECNYQANPIAFRIKWYLNGLELTTGSMSGFQIQNTTLVIEGVQKEHNGEYQCGAENELGERKSESVELNVKYAPRCAEGQRQYYGIHYENITVACHLVAQPENVAFQWSFSPNKKTTPSAEEEGKEKYQRKEITAEDHSDSIIRFTTSGNLSLATITLTQARLHNKLLCWGSNRIGLQTQPCEFFLIPAEVPHPPENCTISNSSLLNKVNVICLPGFNGGLRQDFHLEIYKETLTKPSKKTLIRNLTSVGRPYFTVTGFESGLVLHFYIYASNSKGRSSSLEFTFKTSYASKWGSGEERSTFPVILTLIIILATALPLLLLLLMRGILQSRGQRRRRRSDGKREDCKSQVLSKEGNRKTLDVTENPTITKLDYETSSKERTPDLQRIKYDIHLKPGIDVIVNDGHQIGFEDERKDFDEKEREVRMAYKGLTDKVDTLNLKSHVIGSNKCSKKGRKLQLQGEDIEEVEAPNCYSSVVKQSYQHPPPTLRQQQHHHQQQQQPNQHPSVVLLPATLYHATCPNCHHCFTEETCETYETLPIQLHSFNHCDLCQTPTPTTTTTSTTTGSFWMGDCSSSNL